MSGRVVRRIAVIAGGSAIVAMVSLTASCAKQEEKKAPETTPTTTSAPAETSAPAPSESVNPTEKAPRIPAGPNPFSPSVIAPAAPTGVPGDVPGGGAGPK
jgi:hypothetical protein